MEDDESYLCEHREICHDGVCTNCGLETGRKPESKQFSISILSLLNEKFPDIDDRIKAFAINHTNKDRRRQNKSLRSITLYSIIYSAHACYNIPFDSNYYKKVLDLSKKDLSKAIKMISGMGAESCTNVGMQFCFMTPSDLIPTYAKRLSYVFVFSDESIRRLTAFTQKLMSVSPELHCENHIGVALSIFKIFFDINKIRSSNIGAIVELNFTYLKAISQRVRKTFNNL